MYERVYVLELANPAVTLLGDAVLKFAIDQVLRIDRGFWSRRQFTESVFVKDDLMLQYGHWLKMFHSVAPTNSDAKVEIPSAQL